MTPDLTLGQSRTLVIYKENKQEAISKARQLVAELIDYTNSFTNTDNGEAKRVLALSMTAFEDGLMWLVKGITK